MTTTPTPPRRGARLALLALTLALSLLFSFYAGTRYSAQGPTPEEQAQAKVDVWGKVEERPVNDALNFSGTAKSGSTLPLNVYTEGEPILVHRAKSPGDTVAPGDLVGIIGGEGVFALEGPLPLYRDLTLDDSGHDVQELQRALTAIGYRTNTDGKVTEATLAAVTALLRSELRDIPTEGIRIIKRSYFVVLPEGSRVVAQAAQVGQAISPDTPLLTLESSAPYVEFSASLREVDRLNSIPELTITTSAGSTVGTVQSIGELTSGPQGASKTVRLEVQDPALLVPDQTLAVSSGGDMTPVLAVPASAVRQDGSSTYLLIPAPDSSQGTDAGQPVRLPIEVLRTGGGWAAISGDISAGDRVLLS